MKTYPESLDRMLDIWNEQDMSKVRLQLEAALAKDVVFIDPTIETHGIEEFEANVRSFRTKYPRAALRKTSGVDSHHSLHRYTWDITVGTKLLVSGFDVSETDAEGKVKRVLGFFGPLPAAAT
jgi:SnoaL-like domain